MKKNARWWIRKIGIALGIVLLSSVGFFIALYFFAALFFFGFFDRSGYESFAGVACSKVSKQKEKEHFESTFGVPFPESGIVITSCDEQSSFFGEGNFYIVLSATPKDLRQIREIDISFDGLSSEGWQMGPIPETIQERTILSKAFSRDFGSENLEYLFMGNKNTSILVALDYERGKAFFSTGVSDNPPR